jgi:hypothetical protein
MVTIVDGEDGDGDDVASSWVDERGAAGGVGGVRINKIDGGINDEFGFRNSERGKDDMIDAEEADSAKGVTCTSPRIFSCIRRVSLLKSEVME